MKRKLLVLVIIGIIAVLSMFLTSCKTEVFSVELTETQGINFGGFEESSIEEGGSFSFTITLDEAYNNSTVIVKVNGNILTPVDGVYTILDISEIKTVTVEGVTADKYSVTLTETTGITYSGYDSLTINEGGSFDFAVTLGAAYNNSTIIVKANGTTLTANNGTYTIANITANQTVTVEGVTADTYSVTLTETTGITYSGYDSLTINEGGSFDFAVALGAAYNNSTIIVKANGTTLTANNGTYAIANITANQTVTVEGVTADTYAVTLTETTGITYSGYDSLTINEGGSFDFAVALGAAYNNSTIIVKANGTTLTDIEGIYTISNITANQTVTVEGVTADTYSVTLTETTGITYSGYDSLTINEGGSFDFAVTLGAAYNNSTIIVKANGTTLTANNGTYTIANITANQTVTVEGVTADTYSVTLTETIGITYSGYDSLTINEGGSFDFAVALGAAYNNSTIIVKANGTTLTANNGTYAIANITANQTVTVEGVTADTYSVTLTETTGITYSGYYSLTINEGGSFDFAVTLGAAYNNSTIIVKANGTTLTANNGTYTIANITANQTVTVEGVTADTYSVTLTETTGITYSGYYSLTINEGGSFDFAVTLGAAYNNSTIIVKANGTTLTANNGTYTIANITANQTVTVEGVTADTYSVNLTETTGITYSGYDSLTINEGGSFDFAVTLGAAYNNSSIIVKANGATLTAIEGIYTISNITANQTFTVEGVTADTYTVTLTTTDNVTYGGHGDLTIFEGNSFDFTITLDEAYNNSTITVKANGNVITPIDGVYTILNIFEDKTVTLEGVTADTYTVTLTATDNVTYGDYETLTINEGDDFLFTVTIAEGFALYETLGGVTANNMPTVNFFGASYAIPEIGADQIVKVSGVGTAGLTVIGTTLTKAVNVATVVVPIGTKNISQDVFRDCVNVATLSIPDSLTNIYLNSHIESTAWYNALPDGVVYVGKVAFGYKGTMPANFEMELMAGTTAIATQAFYDQINLIKVILPESMLRLNDSCFLSSGITSINIPDSVTYMSQMAFKNCGNLTTATITENSSLTIIPYEAFFNSGITSAFISSRINLLGAKAFASCDQLSDVTISEDCDIKEIGYDIFAGTPWYANRPNGVFYIGKTAYEYIGDMPDDTVITLKSGTTAIFDGAFYNFTGLKNIILPDSVKRIGSSAFDGCTSLERITIPEGATKIMDFAFYSCTSLISVSLPQTLEEISEGAFENVSALEEIVIPSGVECLDGGVFLDCSVLTIYCENVLPLNWHPEWNPSNCPVVWGYGQPVVIYSFDSNGGSDIASISATTLSQKPIPEYEGKYFIGWYENQDLSGEPIGRIFYSATDITLYARWSDTMLTTTGLQFSTIDARTCKVSRYEGADEFIYIPEEYEGRQVTEIGNNAFENNYFISCVFLPDSIMAIGDLAFSYCANLSFIKFSASLYRIGYYAFQYTKLRSVHIPSSVTEIGGRAFKSCVSLVDLTFAEDIALEMIGREIFSYCSSLSSVVIYGGLGSISDGEFLNCTQLTSIILSEGLTAIENYAFEGCSSFEEIIIPASVEYIAQEAFAGCTNLSSIILQEGLLGIGSVAFKGCTSLEEIIIPASVDYIGDEIVYGCFDLTIYCKSAGPREQWSPSWNQLRNPVVWSYGMPDITFSFETDGGDVITPIVAPALHSLPQPTKAGSYFLGWYDNEFFEGDILLAPYYITEGSAVTLYAEWWSEGTYPEMMVYSFNFVLSADESYYILSYYKGSQNIVYVPSSYKGKPVLEIGGGAFGEKEITDVYIQDGITTIREFAFQDCSKLAYISLPSSLESIYTGSFDGCNNLASISLGASVNFIEYGAFGYATGLLEINIHQDNEFYQSIDGVLFSASGEELLQYPIGKTEKSYSVPTGVHTIGVWAFAYSTLETIIIPEGVVTIESGAFSDCIRLKNINLPDSLNTIENSAFSACLSLITMIIPRQVTVLAAYAFECCEMLESVYIPIEVTEIAAYAFSNCPGLTIYCEAQSKPDLWDAEWYYEIMDVVWGYTMP